ncbi:MULTISPECIES: hypothetical protein [Bacillus]|nr:MULTISPECIES: hypothetical protein [Bacillus]
MVWNVSVEKSKGNIFGYLFEAETIDEAIEQGKQFGIVISANISEEMND